MPTPRTRSGTVTNTREPRWEPLEAVLDPRHLQDFMWMFEAKLSDGTVIHAYKHADTRRYLHLADDTRCFVYTSDDRYEPTDLEESICCVLRPDGPSGEAGEDRARVMPGDDDWLPDPVRGAALRS